MIRILDGSAAVTPEKVLSRMMVDVDAFVGTTPQHDDITCLLVKVG
jgi:serine phosphatase RsbU (regulator of sigma subunit)